MASEPQPGKPGATQIDMVDNEERYRDEPTETTPLTGAGAGQEDGTDSRTGEPRREIWIGSEDFEGVPRWRRPTVYWLIAPYFLFTLAFGGVLVPKLNLIVDLICRKYFTDRQVLDPTFTFLPVVMGASNPQCNIPAVQKNVATFTLIISALTGLLSAITAPKLGSLSDRYGRKRLMVIASCGGLINEMITIFAAKFPETVDYHWIILGAVFDGITGSFTAGSVLGNSYASDCASPSKRGVYIGYLHACLFTGLAFGPLLAGYFVKWTGSLLSIFYVVLGCHAFVILFFWFVMPESLSRKRQMMAREKHQAEQEVMRSELPESAAWFLGPRLSGLVVDNMGAWIPTILGANPLAPLKILFPAGHHNGALRRNLILLAMIDTIMMSAAIGSGTIVVLYSEYMFDWGTFEASRFVSAVSLVRVMILLCILPIINYVFRLRPLRRQRELSSSPQVRETNAGADNLDVWLLRIAIMCDTSGLVGYIFARTEATFFLCGIATAFGGLANATVQSSITKHVPAERVGSLLGATGLLHALGRVFAPALFNGIYAGTIETFPQAFFVVLASLFGCAVLGSWFVRPHLCIEDEGYVAVPAPDEGNAEDVEIFVGEEAPREPLPRI
ncbi:major facilitator superfamily domain-containing protein [Biscogniauxia marginata]|nr:major facilitator superfamily domain-containing protein [Biscogniauxia marginata]